MQSIFVLILIFNIQLAISQNTTKYALQTPKPVASPIDLKQSITFMKYLQL